MAHPLREDAYSLDDELPLSNKNDAPQLQIVKG
jgi:hypothetical protein